MKGNTEEQVTDLQPRLLFESCDCLLHSFVCLVFDTLHESFASRDVVD